MASNVTNVTGADLTAAMQMVEGYLTVTWVLLCTFLTVSMQLGFAMLEVGSVRRVHRMTVLAKNIMDSVVSCIAFRAYLEFKALGLGSLGDVTQFHLVLFQWSFCATSVAICSSSMTERTHLLANLLHTALMAGLIYPVVASASWGTQGALSNQFHNKWHDGYNYHDFAGSGVVHLTGGSAAFVGSWLLGRRIVPAQRAPAAAREEAAWPSGARDDGPSPPRSAGNSQDFGELEEQDETLALLVRPSEGWPRRFDDSARDSTEFRQLSYLQVIGMFTLWIGWYGFNSGSTLCMSRACSGAAGSAAWNTTLAACCGGFGAYLFCFCASRNLDTGVVCNGILSGLVSITAGCDIATEVQAAIIGLLGGLIVYPLSRHFMHWLLLDDPVDAIPVHAACGLFGVLSVAFCRPDCEGLHSWGGGMVGQMHFCNPDFSVTKQLLAQVWGAFTEWWWTSIVSFLLWVLFAIFELMRAQEVKYLEDADLLLCQMVMPEPSLLGTQARWQNIARRSPLARRILRRHGWTGSQFADGVPNDVWSLRMDLRKARGEKAETGLEVDRCWLTRALSCVAALLHTSLPCREASLLFRLRISPISEISGLGAADMDGGQVAAALQHLAEVQRDQHDQSADHTPLKHEVRELSRMVQSQDMLIQALRRGRVRTNDPNLPSYQQRRHLASVPEQGPETDAERSRARSVVRSYDMAEFATIGRMPSMAVPVGASPTPPRMSPVLMPSAPRSRASSIGSSSGRTVSDNENGTMTPHSALEDTPPPSVIGRRSQGRSAGPMPQVQDIASQLVQLLQAQQHLMASLQHSLSSTPTPPGAGAPAMGQQQALSSALNQLMAQQLQQHQGAEEARSLVTSTSMSTNSTDPLNRSLGHQGGHW